MRDTGIVLTSHDPWKHIDPHHAAVAEGWGRHLRGSRSIGIASAGIVGGTAVKEGAITVMKESGVDISKQTSDSISDFQASDFDVVITCCGCGAKLDGDLAAWKKAPVFADWSLDDPPAIDPGDLSAYCRVRDECKERTAAMLNAVSAKQAAQAPASSSAAGLLAAVALALAAAGIRKLTCGGN